LGESWDGDLSDIITGGLEQFSMINGVYVNNKILEEYRFFEKITSCGQNCTQCHYCDELASQIIEYGLFTEEKTIDAKDKFPQRY
jgi:hypothetical protein